MSSRARTGSSFATGREGEPGSKATTPPRRSGSDLSAMGFTQGLGRPRRGFPSETLRWGLESLCSGARRWRPTGPIPRLLNAHECVRQPRSPAPGNGVLKSGERLFLVDVLVRSVTELLLVFRFAASTRPAASSRRRSYPAAPVAAGGARQFEYQKWLAVRTADRIILLNPDAGRREEYVLPAGSGGTREFGSIFRRMERQCSLPTTAKADIAISVPESASTSATS